jgi:hypothetical protein
MIAMVSGRGGGTHPHSRRSSRPQRRFLPPRRGSVRPCQSSSTWLVCSAEDPWAARPVDGTALARRGLPDAQGYDARSGEKGRGGGAEHVLGGGAMGQGGTCRVHDGQHQARAEKLVDWGCGLRSSRRMCSGIRSANRSSPLSLAPLWPIELDRGSACRPAARRFLARRWIVAQSSYSPSSLAPPASPISTIAERTGDECCILSKDENGRKWSKTDLRYRKTKTVGSGYFYI